MVTKTANKLNMVHGEFIHYYQYDYNGQPITADYLKSHGYEVIKIEHLSTNDWFTTADGFVVSSNGYVE